MSNWSKCTTHYSDRSLLIQQFLVWTSCHILLLLVVHSFTGSPTKLNQTACSQNSTDLQLHADILWKLFIVTLNCNRGVFVISHLLIPIMQYGDHILCYHKNNCIQQQICKYVATCSTWMIQFIDTFSWKRILKFFMFAMASLVLRPTFLQL